MAGADPADYAIRLNAWLTGRRANVHPEISTTQVRAVPLDRASAAYTIAESDVAAALDRLAQLEQALADVDMRFRLSHGGGWCATCRLPMREGAPVVKTLTVVCEPCAADLAATAGRLDPTRLAARDEQEA